MDAKTLLRKNQAGDLSPEAQAIKDYYDINVNITPQDLIAMEQDLNELRLKTIGRHINYIYTSKTTTFARMAVAAAIVIVLSLVGSFFMTSNPVQTEVLATIGKPGTDQAILTLADGTTINLSEAKVGLIHRGKGIEIIKSEDGALIYKLDGTASNTSEYHTIATPKGGKYKVTLSDGTRVWLNAASSIYYQASLNSGGRTRSVRMMGEAYFEVKKDSAHPFVLSTHQQELEVLGTQFNVTAYPDEPAVKTTLLEGSVRISPRLANKAHAINGVILRPNQQSTLINDRIQVTEVDTEDAVGWKNGEFIFHNELLESIMLEISRWYDVDVIYQDKELTRTPFGAVISRSKTLSEVLSALEKTGNFHFKLEGRTVTVMK